MSAFIFREMVSKDIDHVLRLESTLFDFPYDDVELNKLYRGPRVTCLVADRNVCPPGIYDVPVGYLIFEKTAGGLAVHRLGVPRGTMPYADRRDEIARELIDRLAMRLNLEYPSAVIEVKEHDLDLQLLLRSYDFRLVEIKRDKFPDGDDAYYFQMRQRNAPRAACRVVDREAFFRP